jgi:hypothetical protein
MAAASTVVGIVAVVVRLAELFWVMAAVSTVVGIVTVGIAVVGAEAELCVVAAASTVVRIVGVGIAVVGTVSIGLLACGLVWELRPTLLAELRCVRAAVAAPWPRTNWHASQSRRLSALLEVKLSPP